MNRWHNLRREEKWILLITAVLFLVGSGMHFLYDFTNQNRWIGYVVPINESVWEHTKMAYIPTMLAWWFYALRHPNSFHRTKNHWYTGALVASIVSAISIPMLHYFYSSAFGFTSVIIDVSILFLALLIGQISGLMIYRYGKGIPYILAILLWLIGLIFYIWVTDSPPHIPLFQDSITKAFGRGKV